MLSSPTTVAVIAAVSVHALAATAGGGGKVPAGFNESTVVVAGNLTLLSPNGTFALGFFSPDGGAGAGGWYLGIWYAAIAIRTYVWVANRADPAHGPASAGLTAGGRLAVLDSANALVWATDNSDRGAKAELLDNGNLVLRGSSSPGLTVWESFENPADTWLPEMTMTRRQVLTSWRSPSDPSPGPYSLRIRPPSYGEIELVYNGTNQYWSTGKWTGTRFAGVPEMTVSYIYSFRFGSPFTPEAYFVYSGAEAPDSELQPLLTRFAVDPWGQLMQFTWSPQAGSWENFWFRPEGGCRVYGRCGSLGLCADSRLSPCRCPDGLNPASPGPWISGDFAGGCTNGGACSDGDDFQPFGTAEFDGSTAASLLGVSRSACEDSCRRNCSCFGLNYDGDAKICRTLHGSAYNLLNTLESPLLYIRVSTEAGRNVKPGKQRTGEAVLAGSIAGVVAVLLLLAVGVAVLIKRRWKGEEGEVGGREGSSAENIPVTNLYVFSYKELSTATRGFTEKLGHGGFGAVFRGALPDSTEVAVKRLERVAGAAVGAGEREFRAEVRTIGAVHHVNIARLRGFCCEGPHRILVYDYMPNGPLSSFLRRGGQPAQPLAWPARFGIAVGTARGIAYLHEECRDCIIHCDIKPENILLDGDYSPKVSDFGLARLVGRELSRVLVTMRGTLGYVAPEWISGVAITPKADVYSYGMTLLELLGGRRNVEREETSARAGARGKEDSWFFPAWAARKIVEGGVGEVVDTELGDRHGEEAERVGRVAVWCIQDGEEARPAMGAVVKMLEGAIGVPMPPLPQLLQALVARVSSTRGGLLASASASCSVASAADGRQSGEETMSLG